MQWLITWIVLQPCLALVSTSCFGLHDQDPGFFLADRNKHLKPDRDTNLNDPRSEVDRSDCNLRLVWSSMEQKIEFSIAKSGFRLTKRNTTSFKALITLQA